MYNDTDVATTISYLIILAGTTFQKSFHNPHLFSFLNNYLNHCMYSIHDCMDTKDFKTLYSKILSKMWRLIAACQNQTCDKSLENSFA